MQFRTSRSAETAIEIRHPIVLLHQIPRNPAHNHLIIYSLHHIRSATMRSSLIFFCAALASAQKMCPLPPKEAGAASPAAAPTITDNPHDAKYTAELKSGAATGRVTLSSADKGVKIHIKLTLPKEGAPFMYHIHAKPVPAVCTLAFFLLFTRGEPLAD